MSRVSTIVPRVTSLRLLGVCAIAALLVTAGGSRSAAVGPQNPTITGDAFDSFEADISTVNHFVDSTGKAIGRPAAPVTYHLSRTRVGKRWKAVMTTPYPRRFRS